MKSSRGLPCCTPRWGAYRESMFSPERGIRRSNLGHSSRIVKGLQSVSVRPSAPVRKAGGCSLQ